MLCEKLRKVIRMFSDRLRFTKLPRNLRALPAEIPNLSY